MAISRRRDSNDHNEQNGRAANYPLHGCTVQIVIPLIPIEQSDTQR
jgi:hypothetical protein